MSGNDLTHLTRRRFLQGLAGGALLGLSGALGVHPAFGQNPPNCPPPPTGGTPFTPGQDTRPIVLRKSINSFSATELNQLQQAFHNLRNLPSTDKRTWVLQADIHALYCQQCSNDNAQIHGSWFFFPWHRAYLYYYERILGSLVGDLDNFRLPYWDWENIRTLPAAYTAPGSSANSLWDAKRDPGLAGGGSLPPFDGTAARIATLNGINDFATFGGSAGASGACEVDPHNTIHGDTGQPTSPFEDMGNLGYAARDPVFFAHHCNIDKLWSNWNAQPKAGLPPGSYQNPTDTAFLNTSWSFYDEMGNPVSMTVADTLDHQTNLRYTYTPRHIIIPPLEEIIPCWLIYPPEIGPGPLGPEIGINPAARESLMSQMRVLHNANSTPALALVLQGVTVPPNVVGNFDIFAVRGDTRIRIGTLSIIAQTKMSRMTKNPMTLVLDASKAVNILLDKQYPARLQLVGRGGKETFVLKAKTAQIRIHR